MLLLPLLISLNKIPMYDGSSLHPTAIAFTLPDSYNFMWFFYVVLA